MICVKPRIDAAVWVLIATMLMVGCSEQSVRPDQAQDKQVIDKKEENKAVLEENKQPQAAQVDAAPSLAGEVSEPPADEPGWSVGDRWLWSDGYGLEVAALEQGTILMKRTDADGQWQRRDGFFVVESRDRATHRRVVFRSDSPDKLFPLKLGNQIVFKREYLANGQLRVHRTSWVVEGREEIEVPAGRFKTWVLTRRSRSLQSDWTSYERIWFSPEAKHYVRMEYRYGRNPSSSRVLMAFRLMP